MYKTIKAVVLACILSSEQKCDFLPSNKTNGILSCLRRNNVELVGVRSNEVKNPDDYFEVVKESIENRVVFSI